MGLITLCIHIPLPSLYATSYFKFQKNSKILVGSPDLETGTMAYEATAFPLSYEPKIKI